jgi:MFS transporter, PAT family, beta-lactamase induction signal transducer AmpG
MSLNLTPGLRAALRPESLIMLFLGFSAGLPYVLIFSTLSLWLSRAGVDVEQITMLYWAGMLFATKFIFAPFIDQLKLPVLTRMLGRRRGWMILSQLGIFLSLMGMGLQDPLQHMEYLALLSISLAFCSAIQDIVVDAFRIECAPQESQGILAATYLGGYRSAMLLCKWGAPVFATWLNQNSGSCMDAGIQCGRPYDLSAWQTTYWIMAGFSTVGMMTTLIIREPMPFGTERAKRTAANFFTGAIVQPFADFFARYGKRSVILLSIIGLYRISDIVMGVIANPFYVKLGFSDIEIANVTGAFGMLTTLMGAGIGGVLVSRYGIVRILFAGAVLASATNLLFAVLAISERSIWGLAVVIVADNISAGIATASFIAFLSSLTNVAFSATQYALFSSLMGLLPKLIAGFSGALVANMGYPTFFVLTALPGVPVIFLLTRYLRILEKKDEVI